MPESVALRRTKRFDSPEQEVFLNLWRTYDRLRALEDDMFARHGLTAQQYNALRLLRAADPGTVPTLALGARLVSRAPDITRLLDRLAQRGLISRDRPAENRRTVMVGITAAGRAMLDQLAAEVRECHARQLGHLNADEMATLVALLHKARAPHEPPGSNWASTTTATTTTMTGSARPAPREGPRRGGSANGGNGSNGSRGSGERKEISL